MGQPNHYSFRTNPNRSWDVFCWFTRLVKAEVSLCSIYGQAGLHKELTCFSSKPTFSSRLLLVCRRTQYRAEGSVKVSSIFTIGLWFEIYELRLSSATTLDHANMRFQKSPTPASLSNDFVERHRRITAPGVNGSSENTLRLENLSAADRTLAKQFGYNPVSPSLIFDNQKLLS